MSTKLFRYLIVGGMAFMAEYTSFVVMYFVAGVALTLANGLSFFIGLLTSFLLNRWWTFGDKTYKKRMHHQFIIYAALSLCNLFATILLVAYFKEIHINPGIGKLLAMAITSTWNFTIFKLAIFNHSKKVND